MKKLIARIIVSYYRSHFYHPHSPDFMSKVSWAKGVLGDEKFEALLHKPTH